MTGRVADPVRGPSAEAQAVVARGVQDGHRDGREEHDGGHVQVEVEELMQPQVEQDEEGGPGPSAPRRVDAPQRAVDQPGHRQECGNAGEEAHDAELGQGLQVEVVRVGDVPVELAWLGVGGALDGPRAGTRAQHWRLGEHPQRHREVLAAAAIPSAVQPLQDQRCDDQGDDEGSDQEGGQGKADMTSLQPILRRSGRTTHAEDRR